MRVPRSRPQRRIRGYSLIDVLVTLFCILLGTLTVFSLGAMSTRVSRQAESRGVALALARGHLETLGSLSSTNRKPGENVPFEISGPAKAGFVTDGGVPQIEGTQSITEVGTDGVQRVTVRIRWRNRATEGATKPWSEVVLGGLFASQPLNVSYSGVSDPPPPAPAPQPSPAPAPSPAPKPAPAPAPKPVPAPAPAPAPTEEVGGCTFTYGPC